MTVYADILFIVNFSLDYVSLYITGRLMSLPLRMWRLCAAAALGAVYAVTALFFDMPEVLYITVTLGVSCVMCMCAYRCRGAVGCVSASILLFSVGCALGGAMTALYSLGAGYEDSRSGETSTGGAMVLVAAMATAAVAVGGRISRSRRGVRVERVTVTVGDRAVSLDALYDSGNLLRDPVSGRAAMIVSSDAIAAILPREVSDAATNGVTELTETLPPNIIGRVRVLPVSNVYGHGMLLGYRPDCVSVGGRDYDFILAISDKKDGFGGCDAILPAETA